MLGDRRIPDLILGCRQEILDIVSVPAVRNHLHLLPLVLVPAPAPQIATSRDTMTRPPAGPFVEPVNPGYLLPEVLVLMLYLELLVPELEYLLPVQGPGFAVIMELQGGVLGVLLYLQELLSVLAVPCLA